MARQQSAALIGAFAGLVCGAIGFAAGYMVRGELLPPSAVAPVATAPVAQSADDFLVGEWESLHQHETFHQFSVAFKADGIFVVKPFKEKNCSSFWGDQVPAEGYEGTWQARTVGDRIRLTMYNDKELKKPMGPELTLSRSGRNEMRVEGEHTYGGFQIARTK